jgi:selenophosphate synthase
VTGEAHPGRLLRNDRLRPGDVLVLSKPLGTGVISTAAKADAAGDSAVAAMIASMCRTNAAAAAMALEAGATRATDVTGFGLLGHLGQMALTSGVDVELDVGFVPLLPGARELAEAGYTPGAPTATSPGSPAASTRAQPTPRRSCSPTPRPQADWSSASIRARRRTWPGDCRKPATTPP